MHKTHYFYKMRQLDLFGMPIDPSPVEDKTNKREKPAPQAEIKKAKATEKPEEELKAEENQPLNNLSLFDFEEPQKPSVVIQTHISTVDEEKPETEQEIKAPVSEKPVANQAPEPPTESYSRSEIFNDGLISVKIKLKTIKPEIAATQETAQAIITTQEPAIPEPEKQVSNEIQVKENIEEVQQQIVEPAPQEEAAEEKEPIEAGLIETAINHLPNPIDDEKFEEEVIDQPQPEFLGDAELFTEPEHHFSNELAEEEIAEVPQQIIEPVEQEEIVPIVALDEEGIIEAEIKQEHSFENISQPGESIEQTQPEFLGEADQVLEPVEPSITEIPVVNDIEAIQPQIIEPAQIEEPTLPEEPAAEGITEVEASNSSDNSNEEPIVTSQTQPEFLGEADQVIESLEPSLTEIPVVSDIEAIQPQIIEPIQVEEPTLPEEPAEEGITEAEVLQESTHAENTALANETTEQIEPEFLGEPEPLSPQEENVEIPEQKEPETISEEVIEQAKPKKTDSKSLDLFGKESKKEKLKKGPQKRGRKSFKEIDAQLDLVNVPEDEELFQKQYYPISEVSKWFGVNTSLLRFWENEFDVLKPRKNRKGDRLFRPEDVKNLQLIYELLRQRKYTIEGAKEYLKSHKKQADTQLQLTQTLKRFKNFLLELKVNLQS